MAITKSAVTIFAGVTVAAGSTKSSPNQTSSTIDVRSHYGGELTWKFTNSASAPGVACSITFQISHDGTTWFDYYTASGDTTNSSVISGAIPLDRGVMYVNAIGYGNTTNAVTLDAYLQAVTAV